MAFFFLKVESSDLPGIGYVLALNLAFYFVYVLFAAELILAITIHQGYETENHSLVKRLRQIGRVAYPTFILIGGAIFSYMFIL